ncbi:predicted protein [Botrytis cinerea T4]|uniref:Uncharacterized protein n=1 Tax=Botryotinia fuckeliana (strain T4) TaxID=999810 RepID=G2YAL6_BOTF4|nr:predicted protein [Botrytis cinerea T4]
MTIISSNCVSYRQAKLVHDSDESRRHYIKKSESWSRAPSSKIGRSEGKQTAQRRGCRWT